MRIGLPVLVVVMALGTYIGVHTRSAPSAASSANSQSEIRNSKSPVSHAKIDFDTQIKPILQSRCQPCHFSGGVMYDRLPFDRAETVNKLGTKLFTRIKEENEQRLIREFLEQQ